MEATNAYLCGCVFFPVCFIAVRSSLYSLFSKRLNDEDVHHITEKCVSSMQATLSVIVGLIITSKCQEDIMKSRHWLTNTYATFAMPYFHYDAVAMYFTHYYSNPALHERSLTYRISHFTRNTKMMLVHHLILPFVFYPAILYLRKGIGDFFVGILYQIEVTIPFISTRMILAQLKHTPYYIVAGLVMIVSFAVSRVLVFPYLYWKYSVYAGIPFLQVPANIPIKCNIGCLIILVPQIYWLFLMIKGAIKVFYKIYLIRKSKAK